MLVAALLHDIGLYDEASHGGAYVADGAEYAAPLLRECGWDEARIALCGEAIERHHELRSQWKHGEEVELIRRGDLVELSNGLIRFGIPRGWIKDLFASVSREGTYGEITRMVRHATREGRWRCPDLLPPGLMLGETLTGPRLHAAARELHHRRRRALSVRQARPAGHRRRRRAAGLALQRDVRDERRALGRDGGARACTARTS